MIRLAGIIEFVHIEQVSALDKFYCIFFSWHHPDGICGPASLLSNGYRVVFPGKNTSRGVKPTTRLILAPRSLIVELHLHYTARLHGLVLN
jgi:hypothetical protein